MQRTRPSITELAFLVCGVLIVLVGWVADFLGLFEIASQPTGHGSSTTFPLRLFMTMFGVAFSTIGVGFENFPQILLGGDRAKRFIVALLFLADGSLHLYAFNAHLGDRFPAATHAGRFAIGPMQRSISAATSFARSRYSCSFIAAGFAEIRRYESFRVIFSFTFCRNRMIDANPFCEIMYSRPSRTTAAFPPSDAKSEMAVAMSTSALGSATAIPFAVPPADLESQMNPAPSIGYRDRKSSGWMRVMQSPRAFVWRRSENSENTRSAFGSRTRYTPRRPMSLRAESSPPPTTGIPSSSMRLLSIGPTSRNRTASFHFASTPSSVDEYPRVVREPISRHADLRPSSKPFRKALRFSSSPIPVRHKARTSV